MKPAPTKATRPPSKTAYSLRMRSSGVLFCLGTLLVGLGAIDSDNNILLITFGLCLGAILTSLCSGWRTLRGLSVTRLAPEIAVAGQPMELRYAVTNHRGWWAARGILVSEAPLTGMLAAAPEAYVPYLSGGEAVTLTVSTMSMRRGRIGLSAVRLSTGFPFGIFIKTISHRMADEVIVFPMLGRLRSNPMERGKLADASEGGAILLRGRGEDEFYGLREYRQGDNPRRIHWRRSAHTGQLMIREMARTSNPQFWCVLDTRIDRDDAKQREAVEACICAVATVICDVLEQGTRVGLICGGEPLVVLPPGTGRHRRKRLLRELAVRTSNFDELLSRQLQGVPMPTRWRGSCILFAARETEETRSVLRFLQRTLGQSRLCIPGTDGFTNLVTMPGESAAAVQSARVGA